MQQDKIRKHFSSPLQVNTVQVIMLYGRCCYPGDLGTSWVGRAEAVGASLNAIFPVLEAGAAATTAVLWEVGIPLSHVTLFLVQ